MSHSFFIGKSIAGVNASLAIIRIIDPNTAPLTFVGGIDCFISEQHTRDVLPKVVIAVACVIRGMHDTGRRLHQLGEHAIRTVGRVWIGCTIQPGTKSLYPGSLRTGI